MAEKTGQKHPGMVSMAQEMEAHHTAPMPGAMRPHEPFPRLVMRALWLSALVGGLIGWLWGLALQAHWIAVPGWEQLHSMEQLAFPAFWIAAGASLGVLLGGIGALLLAPGPDSDA